MICWKFMCSVLFVKTKNFNQIEGKLLAYISIGTTTESALFGVMLLFHVSKTNSLLERVSVWTTPKYSEQLNDSTKRGSRKIFPVVFPGMPKTFEAVYEVGRQVLWRQPFSVEVYNCVKVCVQDQSSYCQMYLVFPFPLLQYFRTCGFPI